MSSAPALAAAQRRFFSALQEPLAGAARAQTELAPGETDLSPAFHATAHDLLQSTAAVSAAERLGLYHRQYWYRLLDSLAEDFPHLLRLLGHDAFWALLERHLAAHPPASFTLRHLGAGLACFIAADFLIPAGLRTRAADLARFEYAFMEVFEAAVLPGPAAADFATHPLRLQPAVRLVPVSHPLSSWLAHPERPADLRPRHQLLVVWRDSGHRLRHTREPLSLLPLLEALQQGGRLETIIARAPRLPAPPKIEAAFARWHRRGWVARSETL